jgi:hypothetical protein
MIPSGPKHVGSLLFEYNNNNNNNYCAFNWPLKVLVIYDMSVWSSAYRRRIVIASQSYRKWRPVWDRPKRWVLVDVRCAPCAWQQGNSSKSWIRGGSKRSDDGWAIPGLGGVSVAHFEAARSRSIGRPVTLTRPVPSRFVTAIWTVRCLGLSIGHRSGPVAGEGRTVFIRRPEFEDTQWIPQSGSHIGLKSWTDWGTCGGWRVRAVVASGRVQLKCSRSQSQSGRRCEQKTFCTTQESYRSCRFRLP